MANIQVRIDDNIKAEADSLFASLGLDTSTAIRMFIAAALDNRGIPFSVVQKPDRDEAIRQAVERRKAGEKFYSIEESMEHIDAAIAKGAGHAPL